MLLQSGILQVEKPQPGQRHQLALPLGAMHVLSVDGVSVAASEDLSRSHFFDGFAVSKSLVGGLGSG